MIVVSGEREMGLLGGVFDETSFLSVEKKFRLTKGVFFLMLMMMLMFVRALCGVMMCIGKGSVEELFCDIVFHGFDDGLVEYEPSVSELSNSVVV